MSSGMSISGTALEAALAKSVLDSLSEESKNELITKSIQNLLETPKDQPRYGQTAKSPILEMFETAANYAARDHVRKILTEDTEFQIQIAKLFQDVMQRVFFNEEARENLVDTLTKAFAKALEKTSY